MHGHHGTTTSRRYPRPKRPTPAAGTAPLAGRFGARPARVLSVLLPGLLLLTGLLGGCEPTEKEREQPPARELQQFSTDQKPARFDGAPSAVVDRAVRNAALKVQEGEATFYADVLEGRKTASGETLHQGDMVAAHRAFPFGTRLRVTNLDNGKTAEVRVIDRGPFGGAGNLDAILDLSKAAARKLGFLEAGRARVRVEVLAWGGGS